MSLSFATLAATRFGYGFRPGEPLPATVDDMMDGVSAGTARAPRFPDGGIARRRQDIARLARKLATFNKANADDPEAKIAFRKRFNVEVISLQTLDEHLRFVEAALSPYGFHERLASFWVDHFSVNMVKAAFLRLLVPLYEAEAIRPNLGRNFADLARAAVLHPAMLIYLDQQRSVGPTSPQGIKRKRGLNENLGRELLELHTLGAGAGYTQTDVRNAAYILTGLGVDRYTHAMTYKADIAEPGARPVFGETYGGKIRSLSDVEDMIDGLTYAPETRRHICRKLAAHFIADDPPKAVVESMIAAWTKTDGELMAVYRAMLDHPESWAGEGQKAKNPFDFIVSSVRALNIDEAALLPRAVTPQAAPAMAAETATDMDMMGGAATRAGKLAGDATDGMAGMDGPQRYKANGLTVPSAAKMGQPLWRPPSPAGFPDGFASWITAGQLTERINWARAAANQFGKHRDPREFLKATLGDAARQDTIDVVSKAPSRQTGVALVLASPEFNRR